MHNEIVLNAGCGTGRVTKIIADTGKKGKVYAYDTDANMISNAKKPQGFFKHIVSIRSDLSDLDLQEKVNLVFSNAEIHRVWITITYSQNYGNYQGKMEKF